MRNLSTATLAKINQQYGSEPITVVKCYWYDLIMQFADKTEGIGEDFFGSILSLSSLDMAASTGTMTITLDDSRGHLYDLINSVDSHKTRCQVVQWFQDTPLSEAIVMFDGVINTPMEWSESERTFTFSVVNIIENREFGFSFEEGRFAVPLKVVGKAWPIVIGTVLKVPALQITEDVDAVLAEGFGVIGYAVYAAEFTAFQKQLALLIVQSQSLANEVGAKEREANSFNDGHGPTPLDPDNPDDDITQYQQLKTEAQDLRIQLSMVFVEYKNTLYQYNLAVADLVQKKVYEREYVRISSVLLPRDVDIEVELNSRRFRVNISGSVMHVIKELEVIRDVKPSYFNQYTVGIRSTNHVSDIQKEKFVWFDGGGKIELISKPIAYIASLGPCVILNVWGRSYGGTVQVPLNYYKVEMQDFGSGLTATTVTMYRALETYRNQEFGRIWDSNEIFCDIIGYVPPRWESIINYTVDTFANYTLDPVLYPEVRGRIVTNLRIDPVSFTNVAREINVPMNFAVLNRPNVYEFIKNLCFQVNVKVWLVGNEMHFMNLRNQPAAVASITDDDVVESSLNLFCTPTESIVTKLSATWRYEYRQPEPNLIIIRYNVIKYGIQAQDYDYFALGQQKFVADSLQFWGIRFGNSWKMLRFKTNLQCLNIEANDPIQISCFGFNVVGIVERAVYDSAANQIEFTVWLPIRWGEKDRHEFAYPGSTTNVLGNRIETDSGSPFFPSLDNGFVFKNTATSRLTFGKDDFFHSMEDRGIYGDPASDIGQTTTQLTNTNVNYTRPENIEKANNSYVVGPIKGVATDSGGTSGNTISIGTVQSGSGKNYVVQTVDGKMVNAIQVYIGQTYNIFVGTVVYLVFMKSKKQWYMQAPVWYDE